MILYKYTTRDAMKKIIAGASLLVRPFNDFNDPFESVPLMSDGMVARIAAGTLQERRSLRWLSANPDFLGESLSVTQIRLRLRDQKFEDMVVKKLVRRARKTMTLAGIALSFQDRISEDAGLVCLTKNPSNILMWSHYAEQHSGFVFALDTAPWKPRDLATEVIYSNKRVVLPTRPSADDLKPIFITKSCDWSYEEEYRILCMDVVWKTVEKRQQDLLPLRPHQIRWICAGIRTPVDDIKELSRILQASPFPNAGLCQATLHPAEFKIELPKECSFRG